jgi:hypothetical protein
MLPFLSNVPLQLWNSLEYCNFALHSGQVKRHFVADPPGHSWSVGPARAGTHQVVRAAGQPFARHGARRRRRRERRSRRAGGASEDEDIVPAEAGEGRDVLPVARRDDDLVGVGRRDHAGGGGSRQTAV